MNQYNYNTDNDDDTIVYEFHSQSTWYGYLQLLVIIGLLVWTLWEFRRFAQIENQQSTIKL